MIQFGLSDLKRNQRLMYFILKCASSSASCKYGPCKYKYWLVHIDFD